MRLKYLNPGAPPANPLRFAAIRRLAVLALAGWGAVASAQLQQAPATIPSPAASDPKVMQWMQGSPPPPERRIALDDGSSGRFPQTRWAYAHYRELYRTARVSRGAGPRNVLPVRLRPDLGAVRFVPLGGHASMTWAEACEAVYADAVLVLHRGQIVYERYYGVMDRDQPHIAFSVTKSFVGTLTETLIAEGRIDPAARVARYVPELASSGFGDASVRQVLDMTTALDYSEDYADPKAGVVRYAIAGGAVPRPAGYQGPATVADYLATVAKAGNHGEAFSYRTVNTEVLGLIIARVTGQRLDTVLSQRLWAPLGMDHDGDFLLDAAGMPLAGGGLNLTLRDLARFGEMMRLGGRWHGRQVVPARAVAQIRAGASKADFAKADYDTMPGWTYRSQWWVTHNPDGAYSARGIYGQAIYIDPKAEMVIVRFASNPVASNLHFDAISLPAYQAIADRLMRTPRKP